jgi:signal recognition particle subunit SRP54
MLDNLQSGFTGLTSLFEGPKTKKLDEATVQVACQRLRRALIEADVSVRVGRQFVQGVRDAALNAPALKDFDAEDQFMGIMHQELTRLLGETQHPLNSVSTETPALPEHPRRILLCGLQGAGKTTTAAKLAHWLKQFRDSDENLPLNWKPYLIAADTVRPAAMEQLAVLASRLDIPCFYESGATDMLAVVRAGMKAAEAAGATHIIVDTAGRLQLDTATMADLYLLKKEFPPMDTVLVVDAMMGQESVNVVEAFHTQMGVSGCVLSKMDGDTKGGAMLSIRQATGLPILFLGTGEQHTDLEAFHPDRMAQRLMGMGDMATLMEKAMALQNESSISQLSSRLMEGHLNFQDYVAFQQHLDKLGGMGGIMSMLPMMQMNREQRQSLSSEEGQKMRKWRALLASMKRNEQLQPELLLENSSRQARVFAGAGISMEAGNALLQDFQGMYQMAQGMKAMKQFFSGEGFDAEDDDEEMASNASPSEVEQNDEPEDPNDPMGWGDFFSSFGMIDDDDSDTTSPKKEGSSKKRTFGLPW